MSWLIPGKMHKLAIIPNNASIPGMTHQYFWKSTLTFLHQWTGHVTENYHDVTDKNNYVTFALNVLTFIIAAISYVLRLFCKASFVYHYKVSIQRELIFVVFFLFPGMVPPVVMCKKRLLLAIFNCNFYPIYMSSYILNLFISLEL